MIILEAAACGAVALYREVFLLVDKIIETAV